MKTLLIIFIFSIVACNVIAQTTLNTSGDWDNAGNWTAGNIGDIVTEDVFFDNNTDGTIRPGFNYTIGNLTLGNSCSLTIDAAGTLNVGDASNPRNLIANNAAFVTVTGTLIVWGDVVVNNNLDFTITGTVIIKGNLVMINGATLAVSGNLTVDGNFTGGNNTDVTITNGGGIAVGGTVVVDNNSDLICVDPPAPGDQCVGAFTIGVGPCTGPPSFCGTGVLPIRLLYFTATVENDQSNLLWATDMEENFDHFEVQRSISSSLNFETIGEVQGAGYNTVTLQEYNYIDPTPQIGINYYRLKAVDLDGTFEYAGIAAVIFNGLKKFEVYPNPASGEQISFVTNFSPSEVDRIVLISSTGKLILDKPLSGMHERTIKESLQSGIYFLRYTSRDYVRTIRVAVH
jgi:hypothetical protein